MHPLAEFECDDLPTKVPVITPSPMPFPSYTPTGTWSPMTPLTTYPPTTTRRTRSLVMPYTGKTPDWVDVDGHGCEWWQVNDLPGYPLYGDEYEGTMGVANDNCCYCIKDTHMLTSSPTEDDIATPEPTSSPTEGDVAMLDSTPSSTEENLSTLEPTSSPTEDGIAKSPPLPTQLCTDTPTVWIHVGMYMIDTEALMLQAVRLMNIFSFQLLKFHLFSNRYLLLM